MNCRNTIVPLILLMGLIILGCNSETLETEASATFQDRAYKVYSIKALEDAGVEFRIEGNQIWYPVTQASEVNAILSKVAQEMPVPFSFQSSEMRDKFMASLSESGIEYTVMKYDSGNKIYVHKEEHGEAAEIFHRLMRGNSKD